MSLLAAVLVALVVGRADAAEWKRLPSLPDKHGFAGPFAGVSHGALLVAGGANFPDRPPWEGGKKVWHDRVYVLEKPDGKWKLAGRLPRSLGYGVSVTHGNSVVCVGGSDANRHYADAFRLKWKAGKLVTSRLPALPRPVANACGTTVGDALYIAGGIETPDAARTLKSVYRIDLSATVPKWELVEPYPGAGRMLAVAASFDGAFYLIGGADLVGPGERRYLKDAYRYDPATGWKRIADLPHPIVAAPSPAPTDKTGFSILGGDDGSHVVKSLERHPGFLRTILQYDAKTDRWTAGGELPFSRVTVPCVQWGELWVVPSGEVRPGVRSSEVWMQPGK